MSKSLPYGMDQAKYDKIINSLSKRMAIEAKKREDFIASDVFKGIVSKLVNNPEPVQLVDEHLAYFPKEALATTGLADYTQEQVQEFLNAMSSFLSTAEKENSVITDADAVFNNATFEAHGLFVHMMFGQGTAVVVRNKACETQYSSRSESVETSEG